MSLVIKQLSWCSVVITALNRLKLPDYPSCCFRIPQTPLENIQLLLWFVAVGLRYPGHHIPNLEQTIQKMDF